MGPKHERIPNSTTQPYATEAPDPSPTGTEQQQHAAAITIFPRIYHTSLLQLGQHNHMREDNKKLKILSARNIKQ